VPRHVRFHDLRHTTATLLLKAGVPLQFVQRILRHADPKTTAMTYGHLDVEDERRGMERFPVTLPAPETADTAGNPARTQERAVARRRPPRGCACGCGQVRGKKKAAGQPAEAERSSGLRWSGRQDLNLRPLGPEPSALPS
jgi:Phage integrase family